MACYQEVAAGCQNWDPVYCTSLLIYCVVSVVNIYLLSVVLHKYRKSQLEGAFWGRHKAWILILSIVLFVIDFFRNFVGEIMPWKLGLTLLFFNQIIQFTVYVLICQFFLKAASKLVGKNRVRKWQTWLKYYMMGVYVFLFAYGAWLFKDDWFPNSKRDNDKAPCHRNEFWI